MKRKALTALHINGVPLKDPNLINEFVSDFYKNVYNSSFNARDCASFLGKIQTNIPLITEDFKSLCESDLSTIELKMHYSQ